MYRIAKRVVLAPNIIHMRFEAPHVAKAARAGQFIIVRVDEKGERLPLSIADWNPDEGFVDVVFYVLGTSTMKLSALQEGDHVLNIAGPLGEPTEISNFGRVICACGCFGIGPTIPLIRALKEKGNYVISVVEGRGRSFIFWEDLLRELSDEVHVVLGDGSCSEPGWANEFISRYLSTGNKVDRIFVRGCPFMMMVVSEASKPFGIKTIVSLTPLMVDGTGMCGACRVEVGGETRFACVDGPDFDGHEVNWRTLVVRMRQLVDEEDESHKAWERRNWHRLAIQTIAHANGRCYR